MADKVKDWVKDTGAAIYAEVQRQFGPDQWNQLSADDQALLQRVSNDYAQLSLQAQLTPPGPELDALIGEKAIVTATLADIESIAVTVAQGTFWAAVRIVAQRIIGLAFAVIVSK